MPTEILSLIELAKIFGFAALIYWIWQLDHKANNAFFSEFMKQQGEREKANFAFMTELSENLVIQNGLLVKLVEKVENNQWCPYLRELQKRGENNR